MKKIYDSTIEDAVYANLLLSDYIGNTRKVMFLGFAPAPLLFILLVFIFGTHRIESIYCATGVTLAYVPIHLLTFKLFLRKSIKKALIKAQGTDNPVSSEYEIDESGIAFRKQGQEVKFSWATVKQLTDSENYIELIMEPAGIATIPKRVFNSDDELRGWYEFIDEHVNSNHGVQSILVPNATELNQPTN